MRPETQVKLSPSGRIPRWEAEPNYGLGRGRGAGGGRGEPGGRGAEPGRGGPPAAGRGGALPPAPPAGPPAGRGALTQSLEGLSIVKPPYGVISAIDLNTGTLKFQVPHGDTPGRGPKPPDRSRA